MDWSQGKMEIINVLFKVVERIKDYVYRNKYVCTEIWIYSYQNNGFAKKFVWVFYRMLWENSNELSGQHNINGGYFWLADL